MQNDLISIIVPIYMTELYIEKCIDSIINQTYRNIEILCIDDCTTDNSIAVVEKYMEKDQRVRMIRHKKNYGLAQARNTGIVESKGKYIAFIDSDDWITNDYIEVLYRLILQYEAEISVCSYARSLTWYEAIQSQVQEQIDVCCGRDAIKKMYASDMYQTDVMMTVAWNKLFKKEAVKGVLFPEGKLYEDQPFAVKAYYNASKVVITNKKLYFYRKNYSGITMQKYNIRILDELDLYDDLKNFFKNNNDRHLYDIVVARKVPLAISRYVGAYDAENIEAMKKSYHHVAKETVNYLRSKTVTFANKIKFLLFVIDKRLFLLYGLDLFYKEQIAGHTNGGN